MDDELLKYFKGDEMAASVWKDKYAMEGEKTPDDMHRRLAKEFAKIEDKYIMECGEGLINKNLSEYGQKRHHLRENKIYDLFKDFKHIIPQGRIMAGLGDFSNYKSLSNCLRLPPPKDSYSSIMHTDTMLVSAAKRGCGYGLGLSLLRPEGVPVRNASGSSTGSVSFAPRFSNSTREVAQKGRRGACLMDLFITHPDAFAFANSKTEEGQITGANISFKMVDTFMKAVKNGDEDFILRWPHDYDIGSGPGNAIEYNTLTKFYQTESGVGLSVLEEHPPVYIKKIRTSELWDTIIHNAWNSGDPGLLFWNRVIDYDPSSVYEKYQIDGTNACGEQPMAAFDTCRLICQNLFFIVKNAFQSNAEVDEELLYQVSYEMMRLGDDLVDLEIEYIDRILDKIAEEDIPENEKAIELELWTKVKDMAQSGRRVGCGITGLGDMLAALNLKYDSEEGIAAVEKVMSIKMRAELDCTIDLAILRGTFEGWDEALEYGYVDKDGERIKLEDAKSGESTIPAYGNEFYLFLYLNFPHQTKRMMEYGRRNVNWSTIAPTGTTSIVAQVTSGCEPIFMPFFVRRKKINPDNKEAKVDFIDSNGDKWQEYPVLHPKFKEWVLVNTNQVEGKEWTEADWDKTFLEDAFKESPWYGSTANDIDWEQRIKVQSVLQKYTTSAISSTVNLPNSATEDDINMIYTKAWEHGLKGITVYRDGCRAGVFVTGDNKKSEFIQSDAPKRPKTLPCTVHKVTSKGEDWLVIVGLLEDKPYEIFCTENTFNIPGNHLEGIMTKLKRGEYRLSIPEVIDIEEVTSEMTDEQEVITRLLSTSLRHGADIRFIVEQLNKTSGDITSFSKAIARTLKRYIPEDAVSTDKCQDCGGKLIFQEGCQVCQDCKNSKC